MKTELRIYFLVTALFAGFIGLAQNPKPIWNEITVAHQQNQSFNTIPLFNWKSDFGANAEDFA